MSMTVQTGGVQYSADLSAVLDKLKADYPDLKTDDYNRIAEYNFKVNDDVERYVVAWALDVLYPDYYQAYYASIKDPDSVSPEMQSKLDEIEHDIDSLVADDLWLIANPNIVPMPNDVRAEFIAKLEKATGESYADHVGDVSDDGDNTSQTMNPEDWDGSFDNAPDIQNVLNSVKGDGLASEMFGFLGGRVLLGRNLQGRAALELAKISEQENKIMAELAGLETAGMSADDPRYQTKLTEIKQKLGDLGSSKEELMAIMQKSQDSIHQLITLFSGLIRQFIEMRQQVVGNMRIS